MLQGSEEALFSGPPGRFESFGGSHVTRSKDGVPIWNGDVASFEEYVEACLMYEQTVVREKRYLCGPRCASELKGAARRILVGKPATWLSHDNGVRTLIAALREERGHPKVPEMSELLMRYFKGSRRQKGESMHDFIMKKAESYTRAQQSMARLLQERGATRLPPRSTRGSQSADRSQPDGMSLSGQEEPAPDSQSQEEVMLTPREESEGDPTWNDWEGWVWSYERGWHRSNQSRAPRSQWTDTSEWSRNDLPEILPEYVQGWFLFMDAGLDTMERNVLQAELRGDFSVRAVEEVLRKHWTDADLRRRDQEKGRMFANAVTEEDDEVAAWMGEWDETALEAEGYTGEEINFMATEREKAMEALTVIQNAKRTLKEARSRQHAVKMSRQFYSVKSGGTGQSSGSMWKQLRKPDDSIKCFRCGGPHRIADCKEPPRSKPPQSANVSEDATFVFLAETENMALAAAIQGPTKLLSTKEVMAQGKAIVDGGATRTIGSVEALSRVMELNEQARGKTGVTAVDMEDRPVFGFGNSSRDQCASTASLEVPLDGKYGTMKVHALDKGTAPVLLSIQSLRKLGAIIDFSSDMAVFRAVDPSKVVKLECTTAGHQVTPLTEDVFRNAHQLKQPMQSFSNME